MQAKKGNLKRGFVFSGQNSFRIDRIVAVKELVQTLKEEYRRAVSAEEQLYRMAV